MTTVKRLLISEPTLLTAAVRGTLLCAIGFGLSWSTEQLAAFMVATEAWFAVFTRANVTPEVNAQEREADAVNHGFTEGREHAQEQLLALVAAGPAQVEVVNDDPVPVIETPKKAAAKKAAPRKRNP
jgi:hypothetical protein